MTNHILILFRRIKQCNSEIVQEFTESWDAYPRAFHNDDQQELIQKQLVDMMMFLAG